MLVEEIRKEKAYLFEQGKLEGKLEDAVNMLRKGLSFSLVSEITGFTREKLSELCEELGIPIISPESMN